MTKILEHHNIIVNKDVAIDHANQLIPIIQNFIYDITEVMDPDKYEGKPSEFIEMVIASLTYTSALLLIALFDMFIEIPVETLHSNFIKSLACSLNQQLRERKQ